MKFHTALLFCLTVPLLNRAVRAQQTPDSAPPPGVEFKIVAPNQKTTFMIGETIRLQLSFANRGDQTFYLDQFYRQPLTLVPLATFEVEPKTGTREPLADAPLPMGISVAGQIPRPELLSAKPITNDFDLNQYIRFETPGTYTIRARTARVFVGSKMKRPQASLFSRIDTAKPLVSQPLTIEITSADPQWQAQQIAAWRALWAAQKRGDYSWNTPSGTKMPAGDLRYFDTRAAALAIIERLGQDEYWNGSGSEAYFWESGLLGFSDRAWLIGAIKAAMARPDYAVTGGLLYNLAQLQALYHFAPVGGRVPQQEFKAGVARAARQNWNLTYAALGDKRGVARAQSLDALLFTVWFGNSELDKAPEIAARLPKLVAQLPDVFADLPPQAQQVLLDDRFNAKTWARIKNPRLAPALAQLWEQTPPASYSGYRPFADMTLHRFYELAPVAGRAAILRDMAQLRPRATFAALALLPDATLPALQEIWWTHLNQNGADQDTAALLIGRYADATMKSRVQTEFHSRQRSQMLSSDTDKGLRQYLRRVG